VNPADPEGHFPNCSPSENEDSFRRFHKNTKANDRRFEKKPPSLAFRLCEESETSQRRAAFPEIRYTAELHFNPRDAIAWATSLPKFVALRDDRKVREVSREKG